MKRVDCTTINIRLGFGLVCLLAGLPAIAAEPSLESAIRCGAIADNFARLACFDSQFHQVPGSTAAPAPTAPPAPVAATAAPAAAAAAGAGFGEDHLKKTNADRADVAAEANSEITARVIARKEISEKRYQLTLDNGQVWRQEETLPKTTPEVEMGDTVRIQRRARGSYLMTPVGDGKSAIWVRVTRQK